MSDMTELVARHCAREVYLSRQLRRSRAAERNLRRLAEVQAKALKWAERERERAEGLTQDALARRQEADAAAARAFDALLVAEKDLCDAKRRLGVQGVELLEACVEADRLRRRVAELEDGPAPPPPPTVVPYEPLVPGADHDGNGLAPGR